MSCQMAIPRGHDVAAIRASLSRQHKCGVVKDKCATPTSLTSMAKMREAPASLAAWMTARPMAPSPKTATDEPASTCAPRAVEGSSIGQRCHPCVIKMVPSRGRVEGSQPESYCALPRCPSSPEREHEGNSAVGPREQNANRRTPQPSMQTVPRSAAWSILATAISGTTVYLRRVGSSRDFKGLPPLALNGHQRPSTATQRPSAAVTQLAATGQHTRRKWSSP